MKQFILHMSASLHRSHGWGGISRLRAEFLLAYLSGIAIVLILGGQFGNFLGISIALAVFTIGAAAAAVGMNRNYGHNDFGLCNLITMSRLAMAASLTTLVTAPAEIVPSTMWFAFSVAVAALLLDGVDGWAARRAGLASRFGAQFDMEVDALLALILAIVAYHTGQMGIWVLALGLPRYVFLAAGYVWPRLTQDLPDSFGRKAVCVIQIGTLVGLLIPVLPPLVTTGAALFAAAALMWSFSRDIRLLLSGAG